MDAGGLRRVAAGRHRRHDLRHARRGRRPLWPQPVQVQDCRRRWQAAEDPGQDRQAVHDCEGRDRNPATGRLVAPGPRGGGRHDSPDGRRPQGRCGEPEPTDARGARRRRRAHVHERNHRSPKGSAHHAQGDYGGDGLDELPEFRCPLQRPAHDPPGRGVPCLLATRAHHGARRRDHSLFTGTHARRVLCARRGLARPRHAPRAPVTRSAPAHRRRA